MPINQHQARAILKRLVLSDIPNDVMLPFATREEHRRERANSTLQLQDKAGKPVHCRLAHADWNELATLEQDGMSRDWLMQQGLLYIVSNHIAALPEQHGGTATYATPRTDESGLPPMQWYHLTPTRHGENETAAELASSDPGLFLDLGMLERAAYPARHGVSGR